jgi:hypothetical protein
MVSPVFQFTIMMSMGGQTRSVQDINTARLPLTTVVDFGFLEFYSR